MAASSSASSPAPSFSSSASSSLSDRDPSFSSGSSWPRLSTPLSEMALPLIWSSVKFGRAFTTPATKRAADAVASTKFISNLFNFLHATRDLAIVFTPSLPISFSDTMSVSSAGNFSTRAAMCSAPSLVTSLLAKSRTLRAGVPRLRARAISSTPWSSSAQSCRTRVSSFDCLLKVCAKVCAPTSGPMLLSLRSRERREVVEPRAEAIRAHPSSNTRVDDSLKSSMSGAFFTTLARCSAPASPVILLKKCKRLNLLGATSSAIA
mmetsp:Transcript_408/g.1395  ORF Transcript_408/g.1395 Transcript_408/m.1395 type:complete len:264 (+) Transcript_408:1089-1880(+)